MKTLCMDSAHKHLVIVLIEDGKIISACEKNAGKDKVKHCFRN